MEVRSCCLKVRWDDSIATTKPNIVMTFLVWECYGSPKKHENSLKITSKSFDKVLNERILKNFNVQNEECHY
jgi:hypothetical protein